MLPSTASRCHVPTHMQNACKNAQHSSAHLQRLRDIAKDCVAAPRAGVERARHLREALAHVGVHLPLPRRLLRERVAVRRERLACLHECVWSRYLLSGCALACKTCATVTCVLLLVMEVPNSASLNVCRICSA